MSNGDFFPSSRTVGNVYIFTYTKQKAVVKFTFAIVYSIRRANRSRTIPFRNVSIVTNSARFDSAWTDKSGAGTYARFVSAV